MPAAVITRAVANAVFLRQFYWLRRRRMGRSFAEKREIAIAAVVNVTAIAAFQFQGLDFGLVFTTLDF